VVNYADYRLAYVADTAGKKFFASKKKCFVINWQPLITTQDKKKYCQRYNNSSPGKKRWRMTRWICG